MKRFLKDVSLVLMICATAFLGVFAISPGTARADIDADELRLSEAQALTRAVPTSANFVTGTALKLHLLNGYRIMLCAASGQTLSGAGTLQAYWHDDNGVLVARNPELDKAVSVTATSCQGAACRCQVWSDNPIAVGSGGWLMMATNGVTVSGGTVTVYYFGYKRKR